MSIKDTNKECKSCGHMIRMLTQRKHKGETMELYFCNNCSKWSDKETDIAKGVN